MKGVPTAARVALASRECVQEGKTSDVMLPSSGTNENLQEWEKKTFESEMSKFTAVKKTGEKLL